MTDTREQRPLALRLLSWGLRIATAGLLAHAAWGKLTGTEEALAMFAQLGMGTPGRILIGGIEMLAVLLILLPQSTVYGAFLGLGVMIGAIIAHLTMIGCEDLLHALSVAAGCITILYVHRHDASFLHNLWDR